MSFSSVEIATIPAPPHLSDGGSLHSYPPRVGVPLFRTFVDQSKGFHSGPLFLPLLQVIAQQMTFMDVALYAQIQPEEMLLSNWTKPNKEQVHTTLPFGVSLRPALNLNNAQVAPTLTHLARQFNMWSGMVATDIILGNSLSVSCPL